MLKLLYKFKTKEENLIKQLKANLQNEFIEVKNDLMYLFALMASLTTGLFVSATVTKKEGKLPEFLDPVVIFATDNVLYILISYLLAILIFGAPNEIGKRKRRLYAGMIITCISLFLSKFMYSILV